MNDASHLERRKLPGKWASMALTVAVHVGLVVFLVLGVRWQSSPPPAMEVELVAAAPARPTPTPRVEPVPEEKPVARIEEPQPRPEPPKPAPKPEPPKPEPKPEPPKPAPQPDIATKAPEPKKPEPKPEPPKPEPPKPEPPKPEPPKPEPPKPEPPKPEPPKPEPPKPEPPKPAPKPEPRPVEAPRDDYLAQMLAQEAERAQIERLMRDDATRVAAARSQSGSQEYTNRIRAKIRGNLLRPPGLQGNPEAVFVVEQLPDGTIVSARLTRSSGIQALDDAIERAILRSSPLPLPTGQELFQRTLELRFKPMED